MSRIFCCSFSDRYASMYPFLINNPDEVDMAFYRRMTDEMVTSNTMPCISIDTLAFHAMHVRALFDGAIFRTSANDTQEPLAIKQLLKSLQHNHTYNYIPFINTLLDCIETTMPMVCRAKPAPRHKRRIEHFKIILSACKKYYPIRYRAKMLLQCLTLTLSDPRNSIIITELLQLLSHHRVYQPGLYEVTHYFCQRLLSDMHSYCLKRHHGQNMIKAATAL